MQENGFIIDPEIQSLLTPHTKEEHDAFEKLVLEDKHLDPIVVAILEGKKILGDGHNRYYLALQHGLECPVRYKKFSTREQLIQWVIDNQFGRRNLTEERKAYYRGKEYLNSKKVVGKPSDNSPTVGELGGTAKKVAEKHGVSHGTVENDAKFAEAVDGLKDREKEAVLNGTSGTTKKDIINGIQPILCDRCNRVGATKNCSMCKELRATAAKPKRAPKVDKPEDIEAMAVDAFGNPIPKNLRPAYQDPWIRETIDFIGVHEVAIRMQMLANGMDKRKKHYPFFNVKDFCDGVGFVQQYLEQLLEHLKEFRPAGVCPECQGKKCAACKMSGLVPRAQYEKLKGEKK